MRGFPSSEEPLQKLRVWSEAPANFVTELGGDNSNQSGFNDGALARAQTRGLKALFFPPGRYLFETDPIITVNDMTWLGAGYPVIVCQSTIIQADGFTADGIAYEKRAGSVEANARAIKVDPVGAGRPLKRFSFGMAQRLRFYDFFYALDCRGEAANHASDIRYCIDSDRVSAGNAGHANFFYCDDVEQHGSRTTGGLNSAAHNFGNGGGYLRSYGGWSGYIPSGGQINIENFFGPAAAQIFGGQWAFDTPNATDEMSITVDDSSYVELIGVECGGYIRLLTSTGICDNVQILGGRATRLRAASQAGGTPQYIDNIDVIGLKLTGVPGIVGTLSAFNFDGNYLRRAHIRACRVIRFQADGTSENWANAVSVARAANLDCEFSGRNDFGGRPITASGGIGTGKLRFGYDNVNYGTLTQVQPEPPVVPFVAGPTDTTFADYTLRNGMLVWDSTATQLKVRNGTNTYSPA
jgi:hypothetical protein